MEPKELTPSQYFDYIKGAKNKITTESLKESYSVFIKLAEKYNKLGQTQSLKKLSFLATVLQKEEKLIELGITTFIYKDIIEDYIENVADKTVKIVELSRYMREIPDELVETVEKSREIFDELYVIFTDYTGNEERKVEKERRDKDPILFGVFKNNTNVCDRFYFLGDWEDEYCDLTLDKMVEQYKEKKNISPEMNISIPQTTEELVEILKHYVPVSEEGAKFLVQSDFEGEEDVVVSGSFVLDNGMKDNSGKEKKSFFAKVRSIFNL